MAVRVLVAFWQLRQVTLYHRDFEKEKEVIFDIAADMTRQYKGMQEELLSRINMLEGQARVLVCFLAPCSFSCLHMHYY